MLDRFNSSDLSTDQYRLSYGDRLHALMFNLFRGSWAVAVFMCVTVGFTILRLPARIQVALDRGESLAIALFGVLWPLAAGLGLLLLIPLISNAHQGQLRRCTAGPDGFTIDVDRAMTKYRWSCIRRVCRTQHALYVVLNMDSGYSVPRHVFADNAKADAFFQSAIAAWETNRHAVVPFPISNTSAFSLRYALTKADYAHGYQWTARRTGMITRYVLLWLIGGPLIVLLTKLPYILAGNGFMILVSAIVAMPTTIILGLFFANMHQLRASLLRPENGAFAPALISLDGAGVLVEGMVSRNFVPWPLIKSVSADARLIYFLGTSTSTFFIPRNAFLEPRHAEHFIAAAQAFQRGETPVALVSEQVWPPAPAGWSGQ